MLPDGSIDPSFGDQGVAVLGPWGDWSDVEHFALQSDGKLVGVGSVYGLRRRLRARLVGRLGGVLREVEAEVTRRWDPRYEP